jgi:hypothetical protein
MQSPAGSLSAGALRTHAPTRALGTGRAIIERAVVHTPIGIFFLTRPKIDPFTQQQMNFVTTFADQA